MLGEVKPLRWDRAPVLSRVGDPGLVAPVSLVLESPWDFQTGRLSQAVLLSLGLWNPGQGTLPGTCAAQGRAEERRAARTPQLRQAGRTEPGGRGRRANLNVPIPAPSSWCCEPVLSSMKRAQQGFPFPTWGCGAFSLQNSPSRRSQSLCSDEVIAVGSVDALCCPLTRGSGGPLR